MKLPNRLLALCVCFAAVAFVFAGISRAQQHEGEDVNVHNKTGHEVLVFLFQDDHVHLDEAGRTQVAHIQNGESTVAHVPHCTFSILLVDDEDVWHAEFHDCHSTEVTFGPDTGHAKKPH